MIERLERGIAELEGPAKPGGPPRIPGLKPKANRKPSQPKPPRQPCRHGFARARMTPTHRVEQVWVEQVMENCPDGGTHRSGGWTQRTREVIDLPAPPVQVTEHVYIGPDWPREPAPLHGPGGNGASITGGTI